MNKGIALSTLAGFALFLPQLTGAQTLSFQPVGSGFSQPVFLASPVNDSRLFVVEQRGRIRILNGSTPTTFLDLSATGSNLVAPDGERGLLGLAFDPNYATNGRFYVDYIDRVTLNTVVARYFDPAIVVAAPETIITVSQPAGRNNHKAGWIGFRPGDSSNLYIATGDGGSADDPDNFAQNISNNLGKILRLDVSGTGAGYSNPATNPFVGVAGNDEIWAFGLRNPYRNSFDRLNGNFYIGDVGQGTREEIDFEIGTGVAGRNYGWRPLEGSGDNPGVGDAAPPGATGPFYDYLHGSGASVTGGYVYRGDDIEGLAGTYFFGDYVRGTVSSFRYNGTTLTDYTDHTALSRPAFSLSSFGEGADGELYVLNYDSGTVSKLVFILLAPRLFFQNTIGQIYLWLLDDQAMVNNAYFVTGLGLGDWRLAARADLNRDGRVDLLFQNTVGQIFAWLLGDSDLPVNSFYVSESPLGDWRLVAAADLNSDGNADLLLQNDIGQIYVWLMSGHGVPINSFYLSTSALGDWRVVAAADLNGDAQPDLIFQNAAGQIYTWLMDGQGTPINSFFVTPGGLGDWRVRAALDVNKDGHPDLLLQNTVGQIFVWLMNTQGMPFNSFFLSPSGLGDWRLH